MGWKDLVKNIAPVIGTALGSPIAGMALKFLGDKFLGNENASEQDVAKYILSASPDILLKLKQSDNEFAAKMAQVGVDLEKIAADDRKSARDRQIALRDPMPAILMILITIGFFGILTALIYHAVPLQAEQALNIMLGALGSAWLMGVAYYFGSSAGSRIKDLTLYKK